MADKDESQEEAQPNHPPSMKSTKLAMDMNSQLSDQSNENQSNDQPKTSDDRGLKDINKSENAENPIPENVPTQSPGPPVKHPASGRSPPKNYHLLRFPLRVGITWKKGAKLEAMDFSRTWYPSKIVEIDEDEKCVLIHFEGWNSRYDEWVAMDSEKLRPPTRHSERKDKGSKKRRNLPHPCPVQNIYRIGEQVLARWTDCKKYPAKINRPMDDGSYEVTFYDGVTRLIQPINIQPMPEEMKIALEEAPKSATVPGVAKSSFKDVVLQLPDHVVKKTQASVQEPSSSQATPPAGAESESAIHRAKLSLQARRHALADRSPCKKKRVNILPGLSKRIDGCAAAPLQPSAESVSDVPQPVPPPQPASGTADLNLTPPVIPDTAQSVDSVETSVSEAVPPETSQILQGEAHLPVPKKRVKKRANTDSHLSSKKKKQKLKKAMHPKSPSEPGTVRAKSFDLGAPSPVVSLPPYYRHEYFVPSKAFVVEEDHNHFKCPHEGCGKAFRKENLLTYHIKYYHADPDSQVAAPASSNVTTPSAPSQPVPVPQSAGPPSAGNSAIATASPLLPSPLPVHTPVVGPPLVKKRRRKTDSVCSTDSDLSISSRGKSSGKRHRHDSEVSVTGSPDLMPREAWTDLKLRPNQDGPVEDVPEYDKAEMEADVVHCVCGIRETNGLMIQCDVCMCWQHFLCVDTKGTGVPPSSYVCLACEKPKGVRDSCRFMYDVNFERHGELPAFSFSSGQNHSVDTKVARLKSTAKKCNALSSILLGMKSALHSTRRQIKISKEEDDREFQLWQTDWDNWTKPEEDLTLTPHSVDPIPSPTPSTFLFPPTPTPPASSNLSNLSPSASSTNKDGNLMSPSLNINDDDNETADTIPLSPESNPVPPASTSAPQGSTNAIITSPSTAISSSLGMPATDTTNTNSSSTESSAKLTSLSVKLSPIQADPSDAENAQSCSITPPASRMQSSVNVPPPTPSSERRLAATSNKDAVSGLACDLFPGPGGDASSSLVAGVTNDHSKYLAENDKNAQLKESSLRAKTEHRSDDKPSAVDGTKKATSEGNASIITGSDSADCKDLLSHTSSASQTLTSTCSTTSSPNSLRLDTISSLPFQAKSLGPPTLISSTSQLSISSTTTSSSFSSVITSTSKITEMKQQNADLSSNKTTNLDSLKTDLPTRSSDSSLPSLPGSNGDERSREGIKKREPSIEGKETTPSEKAEDLGSSTLPGKQKQDTLSATSRISELYIDVNEGQSNTDDCEEDNDTDTAEESSDPYRNCEHNLLVHISNVHSTVESQVVELEQSIGELEKSDLSDPTIQLCDDNVLNDIPALRKSLRKLLQNLAKIQQLSSLC